MTSVHFEATFLSPVKLFIITHVVCRWIKKYRQNIIKDEKKYIANNISLTIKKNNGDNFAIDNLTRVRNHLKSWGRKLCIFS